MGFKKGWLPRGYLQMQDGVPPGKKQQSCLYRPWDWGTWFTLNAVEGRSVAGTSATGKGRAVFLAGSWSGWSHLATCQSPILQGTLIAGTKYGESSTEILSFCLKQTTPPPPPPIHCCIIAAFVFWIEHLFMLSVAGWLFCWKGLCLECDLVFTSRWTVSSFPKATLSCGNWPKGLVIWGFSSGCGQVPLQHRSTHQTPKVSRSSGCSHKTIRFPSSMDWRERIKQWKVFFPFIYFPSPITSQQLLPLFMLTQQNPFGAVWQLNTLQTQ